MKKLYLFLVMIVFTLPLFSQTYLIQEGFESIPFEFSTTSITGSDDWTQNSDYFTEGSKSIHGVVPSNPGPVTQLMSIKFSTQGYNNVYFRFKHIAKIAPTDQGQLRFIINNGTATIIPSADSIYSRPTTGGYLVGSNPVFTASSYSDWEAGNLTAIPQQSWWKPEVFNISSLVANQDSVQITFRINKGTVAGSEASYGWLIDEIEILASPNEIIPPSISFITPFPQDTIFGTGPWVINAKIQDESTIASVDIKHRITLDGDAPGSWITNPMTELNDSIFSFEIPSQPYLTTVEYQVIAKDEFDNERITDIKKFFNKRPPAEVVIFYDSTASVTQPNPFVHNYTQNRVQFIIRADELHAFGVQPGPIQSIAFYVTNPAATTSAGSLFSNFSIKAGQTSLQESPSSFVAGLTEVYSAPNLIGIHEAGWNVFSFSTDIIWDGTSNLIFQKCHANSITGSDWAANAYIWQSSTPFVASYAAYTDSSGDLCGGTHSSPSSNTYSKRPVVKIGYLQTDVSLDAAIASVIEPESVLITTEQSDVKVRIKNSGTTILTSADVYWSLNGVTQAGPLAWTGSMYQDQVTAMLTLASNVTFPAGLNELKFWTSNPNGGTDLNNLNDTLTHSVFVCGGALAGGTYTVGGASPDFSSFEEVQQKLSLCGITGPVVFNIRPGTYNRSLEFSSVDGASFTNTITFKSETDNAADVIFNDTINSMATIYLDSASHYRFMNLTLKGGNASRSRVVEFENNCTNIFFENNIIEGTNDNSSSTNYALVYSSKSTSEKDSILVFNNNTFSKGSYAIYLYGTSSNKSDSITITSNNLNDIDYRGMHLYYLNGVTVNDNKIEQTASSTLDFYGMYFYYVNRLYDVSKNTVLAKSLYYGIYLSSSNGLNSTNRALISNNFIASSTNNNYGTGAYITSANNINFYNNTINITGPTKTGTRGLYASSGSNIDIRNNILANSAGGVAIYVSTQPTPWLSNYNNLYTSGVNLGYVSSNRTNLSAWKTGSGKDTNSVSVNPFFMSWDNPNTSEIPLNNSAQAVSVVTDDLFGNPRSATTPDMGAVEFDVAAQDIAIWAITRPKSSQVCNENGLDIRILVRNMGTDTIHFDQTSVTFKANVVNAPNSNDFTFVKDDGFLASTDTMSINITNALDFSIPDVYELTIWHELATDGNRENDTIRHIQNMTKINSFPYDVDFSSELDPPLAIQQISGSIAWALASGNMTSPTLSPEFGDGRLFFNSYTGSGAISRAMLGAMDFTGLNSPVLEFWMSQDVNGGATSYLTEGVTVRASIDGGTSWTNDTLFVRRYNEDFTNPGWKRFELDLSDYAGETCVRIAFDGHSQAGYNISIDRIVVRDVLSNDARTNYVQAIGQTPVSFGSPVAITTEVENYGADDLFGLDITLDITGANTHTEIITIDTLLRNSINVIKFNTFAPTALGDNHISVSVVNDDDNTNNTQVCQVISTIDEYSHADSSAVNAYQGNSNGLLLAKYRIGEIRSVRNITAYISPVSTIGKKIYGVVVNSDGDITAKSDTLTISDADTASWVSLPIIDWNNAIFTDTIFYAGIAQIGSGGIIGSQKETPLRTNTFYTAPINGGTLDETLTKGKLMIGAIVGELPADDAELLAITNPISGCGVGVQPISIKIFNQGSNDILANELTAWYSVDGGTAISEQVNATIPSGTSYDFSFTQTADFTPPTDENVEYEIDAWINLTADPFNHNDSLFAYNVLSQVVPPTAVITTDNPMDANYMESVYFAATNPGTYQGAISWYLSNDTENAIHVGADYTTGILQTDTSFFVGFQRIDDMGYSDTIGNGTSSNSYIPFYGLYDYGWSAMLLRDYEMDGLGSIDTIKYQLNSTLTSNYTFQNVKMYMAIVPETEFSDASQPIASSMTLAYEGDMTILANNQWMDVPIDGGFMYDGSGSLLIYWENHGGDWTSGYPSFKATSVANVAKYKYQDNTFPNTAGNSSSTRPNVMFYKQTLGCVSELVEIVVNVDDAPINDIMPTEVVSPITQCYLENENIVVRIKNVLPNIVPIGANVYCQINGGTTLTGATNTTIDPNEVIEFTFPDTYDFSSHSGDTDYELKIWTSMTEDTYLLNDTILYNFTSKFTALPLTFTDVDIPYGTNYTFNYDGILAVYDSETALSPFSFDTIFTTPFLYDTAYYWMEGLGSIGDMMDVTVGNGTESTSYIPYYGFYNYGWSAALYKQSEIGGSGNIDTIHFQINTANTIGYTVNNQKVYMATVSDTVFANTTMPDPANMTLVYEGSVVATNTEWLSIGLDNAFSYDGTGSLLIFYVNENGNYSSGYPTFKATSIPNMAKYTYSDGGINSGSLYMSSSRTNISFKIQELSCPSDRIAVAVNTTGHPAQDGGIISYNGPLGGAGWLSTTEHIDITIKNFGTESITNFPVSYQINNNTPVTEIFTDTIVSGATANYIFTASENLTANNDTLYPMVYIAINGDNYTNNDTVFGMILPPIYCDIIVTSPGSYGDIGNVTLANLNNGFPHPLYSNPTAVGGYRDYTDSIPTLYLVKGVPYSFKATTIIPGTYMYTTTYNVYVDYNRNAIFEPLEVLHNGTTPGGTTNTLAQATTSGSITIPAIASTGYTRMRVVNKESSSDAPACGSFSYGEVEDYLLYIAEPATVDAALTGFESPSITESVENAQMPIVVKLTNTGTSAITSATIRLLHNGNEYTYDWTGSLTHPNTVNVIVDTLALLPEMNYFTAIVEMTGDEVAENDTIRTQIFAVPQFDLKPIAMVNPSASICPSANQIISASVTNLGAETLDMNTNNLIITANVTGTQTATYTNTISTGSIAPNQTVTVQITDVADFSVSGDYTVEIITNLPNDGNIANDTLTDSLNVTNIIANLPITEDFTSFDPGYGPFPNNWEVFSTTTSSNKYRWLAAQGQTLDGASSGPLADHTTATATGKYVYAYTGDGLTNDKTQLESQCYNFNRIPGQENELTYWYHMHGTNIGKLYVEYGSGNTWTVVDSIFGAQQTSQSSPWLQQTVDLNSIPEGYYKVRFVATKGGTNGNIALDDINISKKLPDVGVTQIIKPVSYPQDSVAYGAEVTVKVRIKNHGNTVVTDIPVAYKPVSSAEVIETYMGTLNPGEEAEFTFFAPYIAPSQRTHSLCAYTMFPNDVDSTNNKSCKNVVGYQTDISINTNENGGLFLGQNIPNPAKDITTINYTLPYSGKVQFRVTDVLGKTLWTEDFQKPNGKHQFTLDISSYAPGVYFYTLEFDSNKISKKMTIY